MSRSRSVASLLLIRCQKTTIEEAHKRGMSQPSTDFEGSPLIYIADFTIKCMRSQPTSYISSYSPRNSQFTLGGTTPLNGCTRQLVRSKHSSDFGQTRASDCIVYAAWEEQLQSRIFRESFESEEDEENENGGMRIMLMLCFKACETERDTNQFI